MACIHGPLGVTLPSSSHCHCPTGQCSKMNSSFLKLIPSGYFVTIIRKQTMTPHKELQAISKSIPELVPFGLEGLLNVFP